MDKYKNYMYYKGEENSPYREDGKSFWWKVEAYAFQMGDNKTEGTLSETMCAYLRERHWQGDTCDANTRWETALKRATEMYLKGVWKGSYLSRKSVSI